MGRIASKTVVATIGALLAAAASFVIVPAADAAAGLRFGANYRLSSNTAGRGADVPGLAVDPTNQNHIVEANIDPIDLQCDYHVSFDGGKTWTGGHLTLPASGPTPAFPSPACNPNFDSGGYAHFNTGIVFGSGQNVYITFSIHRGAFERLDTSPLTLGGAGDDSVVAHSTDGGQTYQPAVIAIPGSTSNDTQPVSTRPQIAVQRGAGTNGQDRLYVNAWQLFVTDPGGERRMLVARSDDGGTTWQPTVVASRLNVRNATDATTVGTPDEIVRELSQPVVGPDGAVYAAYRSVDRVSGTTCAPNPTVPTNCIVVAKSTDHGATWTQTSTGVPLSGSTGQPRLAIDPSVGTTGKLYVVYYKPGAGGDPDDIFLQSSTDGNATWSPAVKVNNDAPGAVQAFPQVSVGPTGQVNVIWFDRRNGYPGGSAPRVGDIYFAQSVDGGATFPTNRRVTDRTINRDVGHDGDLGSYSFYGPVALPLPDGSILAAWMDSREGNLGNAFQDIYLSRLSATSGIVKSTMATATPDGLSVLLSRLAYPGGPEASGPNAPLSKVVVVNDSDVAGALAGSVLARANWGPLLASPAGGLPAVVKADAARMEPQGAFVIGDTSTLSPTVSSQLASVTQNGENVVRIAPAASVAVADRPA
ncbi:MAG: glycoside hydrolase, partial [Actinomycetota bacterium]|nr:glycoside hydrolase [Actinomycetota bacterium]